MVKINQKSRFCPERTDNYSEMKIAPMALVGHAIGLYMSYKCNFTVIIFALFFRMKEDLDDVLSQYFAKLDPLSQGILAEIETVKSNFENWEELSQHQKDQKIDEHFIPENVKSKYKDSQKIVLGL